MVNEDDSKDHDQRHALSEKSDIKFVEKSSDTK